MPSEVAQSCPTLCDPMDCSLPGSSVYGIFQARILEWVAISFSGRSSQARDWTQVSRIVGRSFTIWATREVSPNWLRYSLRKNKMHLCVPNGLQLPSCLKVKRLSPVQLHCLRVREKVRHSILCRSEKPSPHPYLLFQTVSPSWLLLLSLNETVWFWYSREKMPGKQRL